MSEKKLKHVKKLALVLNILDEEYQNSVFSGIKKRAKELNVEVICLQHENATIYEDTLVTRFPEFNFFDVDGIILLSSVFSDCPFLQNAESIRSLWPGIPVISVGQQIDGIPSLAIRSKNAMGKLTKHLLTHHNYKQFLYISGIEEHVDSKERKAIFENTISKYMTKNPDLSYDSITGDFSEAIARERLTAYIETHKNKPADVIVCANDNMALGVNKYLKSQSSKHPWSHCAVTGFDDIPQSELEIPAFTTVRQPLREMGEKAVDIMLDHIEGKETNPMSYVESKLIIRESCGCKRKTEKSKTYSEKQLTNIQRKFFQSEHFLRQMSHFAQQLNSCNQEDGLMYTLDTNLAILGINDFALYSFPNPFDENATISKHSIKANELFLRRNGERLTQYGHIKTDTLISFIKNLSENLPASTVVKLLHTSNGVIGCIIYDGPQIIHPYICSISTNLAQTIFRLQTNAQKQKYSEQLEKAVEKRTQELMEENNKRIKVEAEVLKISEMERQRFSTDLHDDICQRLAGLAMLCRCYSSSEKPINKEQMVELTELITETLQTTRQYAHNSFPVELDSLGMKDSLSNLCNTFQSQAKYPCSYEWNLPENKIFTRPQAINIFRIIQEALQNVLKHAKATEVKVEIFTQRKTVFIRIIDNGKGLSTNSKKKDGIGMKSMQYRADQIGAKFSTKRNEPTGTIIELTLEEKKLENC
ncbi:MAG: substrate-binding domain-containing protein [Treponema sp.]|nr:substrate-binding domain-containing protein [Treponema sp.]